MEVGDDAMIKNRLGHRLKVIGGGDEVSADQGMSLGESA